MSKQLIALLLSAPLLFACASPEPTIQTGDDAEVIMDRLHRVDHSRAAIAFVDPDADFAQAVSLPCGVRRRSGWPAPRSSS